MKIRTLLPVAAAALSVGILGLPSAALAAGGDPGHLTALIQLHPNGKAVEYPIHPGETVPVEAGVVNQGDKGIQGIDVNLRIVDDLDLPKEFTNCLYYVDSNLHGAWCEIDGLIPPATKYALSPLHVSAAKNAENPGSSLAVSFASKDFVDAKGGIAALAKAESGQGTTPVAGTGGRLSLVEAPDLPLPKEPKFIGFVPVKLIVPSSSPSTSTSASTGTGGAGTPVTTASSSAPPGGGQDGSAGGGLPVTGDKSIVVAGLGAVLLAGGAGAYVLTRRRRAKFVA